MTDPEQARATQLRNIEAKTGLDLATLCASISSSGRAKHGEVRSWLIETYGLGFGDANGLAAFALKGADAQQGARPSTDVSLDEMYSGKKAHLREVHESVLADIHAFGDFEIAPKKDYVSLRRKKQFATVGPKSSDRVEVGINLKEDVASERVIAAKPGGMCQYTVALKTATDTDDELRRVLRRAFDVAG